MNKIITVLLFSLCLLSIYSFTNDPSAKIKKSAVKWYTWEEAMAACKIEKKKIFLDIYTEWCGWCKRMDEATFQQKEVAQYLNQNFYPVKMDAEMKKDIIFKDHRFSYVKSGRSGMHMLPYSLLEGKMSFPSVVYLTEDFERILISPGYKEAEEIMVELEYAAGEHFKTSNWNQYSQQNYRE